MERDHARGAVLVFVLAAAGLTAALVSAEHRGAEDATRRSVVQRGPQPAPAVTSPGRPSGAARGAARFPDEFRTIDGTGNNDANPTWGAAGANLLRVMPIDYADGAHEPAGAHRAGARAVSNLVSALDAPRPNALGLSDFMWQWGQFLDHDIDETPVTSPGEAFDILVPSGDAWFDPEGRGDVTIPLDRSAYRVIEGVRQQINNITAYIDASNVYGSNELRSSELRALDGTGRLKTSAGDMLPYNVNGFDNAPTSKDPSFFLAGDVRANEQLGLTAMHTLFVREHNHWADEIRIADPELTPDEVYEHARAIVAAEIQAITYRQFLPRLLGPAPLPPYYGYDPEVNAGISNVFATGAYRVGHTMLPDRLMRLNGALAEIEEGHLPLAEAFFRPDEMVATGIDPLLRGLANQTAGEVDVFVVDAVRNFLFGPPGSGGFDLAALNIQRGRDHGLPGYNVVRTSVGLPAVTSFAEITSHPLVRERLEAAYADVNDIDVWVGLLAEPHRPGAYLGETASRILADQFRRLRDGDRFWYESYLPPDLVAMVEQQTLDVIIRRNTGIGPELQPNVFRAMSPCPADIDGSRSVDVVDLLALLVVWGECEGCAEDLNADDVVDVTDLIILLASWGPC